MRVAVVVTTASWGLGSHRVDRGRRRNSSGAPTDCAPGRRAEDSPRMRAGVVLLLAVALAGCGAAAPTDAQIARRGLIGRGDLPAGWRDVRDGRAVRCPVLKPTRRVASVVVASHEFVRKSAGLESSVWVFPSAAAAVRAFAALSALPVQGCWGPG